MTWLFVSLLILWGFIAGIGEGQTMYFAAPRFHPWFRWYHILRLCEVSLLFFAGILCAIAHPGLMVAAGALVLSWELFEVGYAWARLGQCKGHENILGMYSLDGKGKVRTLHIVRILTGIILIAI